MRYPFDEYEPIRIQLRIAIEQKNSGGGHYIRTMVSDAQIVKQHPDRVRTIERATYRYSVALGRSGVPFLDRMRADCLTVQDFKVLLDFFEHL